MADKRPSIAAHDSLGRVTSTNIPSELSDDEIAKGKAAEKFGSSAGTGLGAKEKPASTPMPRQESGEDAGAYSTRLRIWRDAQKANPAVAGQEKALKSMAAKSK